MLFGPKSVLYRLLWYFTTFYKNLYIVLIYQIDTDCNITENTTEITGEGFEHSPPCGLRVLQAASDLRVMSGLEVIPQAGVAAVFSFCRSMG